MMANLAHDLRFALRALLKRPAFSVLATAILALGIGLNTAIFSIADGVVLQPLPYRDAGELVRIWPQKTFNKAFLTELAHV